MMGEAVIDANPAPHGGADSEWDLRPWLLAGILGVAGLLIFLVTDGRDDEPWAMAAAAFLFFSSVSTALSLERERWKEVAIFAVVAGLVMAGLAWRAVNGGDHFGDPQFGFAAGVFATLLALPLFQAGFHRTRFATPYSDVHFFVWTDAVAGAGSLAFVGLSFLMLLLLSQLFLLLKIELLEDLLEEGWFGWTVAGVAFGAAMGVLRNSLKVLGALQSVVLLVLSLLAVPLALALVVFLGAMVVSGPDVLWEATRSATPILLSCAAGSFVLANAIVRDDDTAMTRNPAMRIAAVVLALGILPLTVFAAVSMGTRVAAYGLSPERFWALIAIAVACAYGLGAFVAVVRGRLFGWRPYLRRANMNLAVGFSGVALLLALPVLDTGAISTANQLGRLERGAVSAQDFDYDALKWDFGEAGKKALARLEKDPDATVAKLARDAQARKERNWYWPVEEPAVADKRLANVAYRFDNPALRGEVEELVKHDGGLCAEACVALDLGQGGVDAKKLAIVQGREIRWFERNTDGVLVPDWQKPPLVEPARPEGALPNVEVKPFVGRQIYIDGKPVGPPFE